jgi:4-hydroxybenzoate polyprenyltransferase
MRNTILLTYATLMGIATLALAYVAVRITNTHHISPMGVTSMIILIFLGGMCTMITLRGYVNNKSNDREIDRMTRNN